MNMKWSCGHKGYLNLDWMKNNCYSAHTLENGREKSIPTFATQVSHILMNVYVDELFL